MHFSEIESAIEGILFASGDAVPIDRIAVATGENGDTIRAAAERLSRYYIEARRGIRLVFVENSIQLCSNPDLADSISRILETRKPQRLSKAALEVLSIVAYFAPVTRAYIEQVRGVDSSYTVGALLDRGLIEPCGKLDAPGRPTLYRTGEGFLRCMGISSLEELPELPDLTSDEGIVELQSAIEMLAGGAQLSIQEDG